ncbi:MAG: IscS subfamily cysteine desulfurase [Spongiibacteraceae bacterium]
MTFLDTKTPVYLDYAATTPVDPRVAEVMMGCLTRDGVFGNPASRSHIYGWKAEEVVERARRQVADLIHADPREIVWTSGATESNNLAIKGAAQANGERGRHIVTSLIEHKAVLDCCRFLEQGGFEVTYLQPRSDGLILPAQVAAALRNDTVLVSLMHANNEIGTITDIDAIGRLCRERGILFHVDAAQSAGKLPLDMAAMPVDLLSMSAHKLYGPKGIGSLYVRRRPAVRLAPQIHGGGHERGLRSGTLPTHQVAGMGAACEIAAMEMTAEAERITLLRNGFLKSLEGVFGVNVNGSIFCRLPGNLNLAFAGVDGESLLVALKDVAVSSGSACMSASVEPSYVLRGIGLADERAQASLRFSFGRFTTEDEVRFAAETLHSVLNRLRGEVA